MTHLVTTLSAKTLKPVALRRRLLKILATTAAVWGVGGAMAARAQPSATASGEAPRELRIGYQKAAVSLVILKQQGTLEKRFPATRVRWIEFPAGPQLLEALAVGSLDFGLTGDSPPVFAQAAGKDLLYVGAEAPKSDTSAILVLRDSPLKTLADLKGRKIALQKGSSAHYLLVRAVARAGLQWSDIQPVYLPPADARAAFESRSVDAWAIWDPFYAAIELALQPRVLTTGRGLTDNGSFYLASRALATQHPQVVAALFDELTRADRQIHDKRADTIKLVAQFSGLDAGVVSLFLQRRPRSPVNLLSARDVAGQQRVADSFYALGLIPRPVQVADIVWRPESAR